MALGLCWSREGNNLLWLTLLSLQCDGDQFIPVHGRPSWVYWAGTCWCFLQAGHGDMVGIWGCRAARVCTLPNFAFLLRSTQASALC